MKLSLIFSVASTLIGTAALTAQPLIVQFHADRTSVTKGEKITLTWKVEHADTVVLTPDVGRALRTSDTVAVAPQANLTYTLTARDKRGRVSRPAEIRIQVFS